ncbi:MAG: sugar ABC transporter ATP-binding protein [Acidobacteria bacterium]|nr:sugar ABC transporter ATP-binding protein [Acidobacteriota bacterium]MDA1235390.1 sugar ABC transporter ATP-binding protein [Acidobacteriota bacterium]
MLLELEGIRKNFGGVQALKRGDLRAAAGEVHALIGENGAGKSTMMKIIAGMYQRDGGDVRWKGQSVHFQKPGDAHAVGISMVHQESLLAPHLTVAENIYLGRETLHGPLLHKAAMQSSASRLIEENNFPLQAHWKVRDLSPAQRQLVEICRALHGASSLIIFDEPTASLSESETVEVFRIVRELRQKGIGILYITHRLVELAEIADKVTVLRDGDTVYHGNYKDTSMDEIVHQMVGRKVERIYEREKLTPGKEVLKVDIPGAAFSIHEGEIVGVAGLMGAGRTELCQTLFGVTPSDEGEIRIEGRKVHPKSPREAVDAGIALITEDRQQTGLALELPIRMNITMANLGAVTKAGIVRQAEEKTVSERFRDKLQIRAASVEQNAGRLSGGNQQKVVIAKWLYRDTKIVLFDEPTRGIDVGAKAEVFALMDEMAREGKAILMVSSELPELLQVADRILVMRGGKITAELPRETTQEEIMHHAAVGN